MVGQGFSLTVKLQVHLLFCDPIAGAEAPAYRDRMIQI